ncbi:RtcB family protein [Mycobacterium shinjukuense]|uniref:tRNA-splicing ligase RtcB n=1 Tax=Mycobacterium shinjukuense TaxID=398694 RepID=A0A7I7MT23_9MYCO|nr:RtcB family protein [Mycobacterium shinjukuense]MCV6984990.1 RtcB family protein [Mycobacterium shinjukuense]ORB69354.1 RNA-splicing ligase RtcB [Mycobacterium shinjukuense]BBX74952.1 RNA-splicing ligase RtcB [Mycobacterium shinjukuense]
MKLIEETEYRFRIEREGAMRVPGIVYASRALLPGEPGDKTLTQVANVATLPGIVRAAYAMPDVHWGYGFPIGGVAATDVDNGGVVSPGGVGFDISCGVRLLVSPELDRDRLRPRLRAVMDHLDRAIPRGVGTKGVWRLPNRAALQQILTGGARFAVEQGHGVARDLQRCEDGGALDGADAATVSDRAVERGLGQVGSLGSGNHFLEVQAVDRAYDAAAAARMGLAEGAVCVMIHTGSRGLGHQICTDHVHQMGNAMGRFGIEVPDRQLACVPVHSPEGQAYLAAMAAAANYGRANRQLLTEATRRVFDRETSTTLDVLYDVSHNLAKLEKHPVDGQLRTVCVHRKGATRSLPPYHPELPADLAAVGQPVLIPGTMGTASYVLAGVPENPAFFSTAHGAGRVQSRHQAARHTNADALRRALEQAGILVRGSSRRGLAEETPEAYKDIDAVIETSHRAGLARKIARLVPLGVVKG